MSKLKVAIVCVYYVPEDAEWILDIQLKKIEQHCQDVDYHIYGANVRLPEVIRTKLESHPKITLFDSSPDSFPSPSMEHGANLDLLVAEAIKQQPDLIISLDVDSFPISDEWISVVWQELGVEIQLIAVQRDENDDEYLPHPCCTFLTKSFLKHNPFYFFPASFHHTPEVYTEFLENTKQRVDTGIGLAEVLWRNKIQWKKMVRINIDSEHYLMGANYGNLIYHLGAGSRRPLFKRDIFDHKLLSVLNEYQDKPILGHLFRWIRAGVEKRNAHTLSNIKQSIINASETYFTSLVNKEKASFTCTQSH